MKLSEHPKPGLLLALTPVVLTLLILGTQIFYFGVFEPHIPLAIGLTLGIGFDNGWDDHWRLDCQRYGTKYYLFRIKSTFA
jgi:hypothetical protein